MKFFKYSGHKTYSILTIGLSIVLIISAYWIVKFIYSLIINEPMLSPNAFPVSIFMTNNHYFANRVKDIYLGDISGQLLFLKPSLGLQLYSGFYTTIIWTTLSYIIYLLRKITWTTIKGNPFVKENGKRLRTVGILVVTIPFLLWFLRSFIDNPIISSIKIDNVKLMPASFKNLIVASRITC